MVKKYVTKIIDGEMLWTEVPNLWNKKVQKELINQGYILNEDGTVSKNEETETAE